MRIPIYSAALFNVAMKTIEQIRRENLIALRNELGGVGVLADRIERQMSQVSQWLNASPSSKNGRPRTMSADTSRYIEEKCGKPNGWMDKDHSQVASASAGDALTAEEVAELVTLYGRADQGGRVAILRMARAMVGDSAAANDELKGGES
jgi:hypothetical protein